MNTFLPAASFDLSAEYLDRRRLGKQRVEVVQMLDALTGVKAGWRNHPATRAWAGHEHALARYGLACVGAWVARGYRDTRRPLLLAVLEQQPDTGLPSWVGDASVHAQYRRLLLRKDHDHYSQFEWGEAPLADDEPFDWTPMLGSGS